MPLLHVSVQEMNPIFTVACSHFKLKISGNKLVWGLSDISLGNVTWKI